MSTSLRTLKRENETLREIVRDLHWMARRYVDGRQSYATSLFNGHVRTLLKLGVELNPTGDGTIWAHDAMGRSHDGLSDDEAAMGAGEAAPDPNPASADCPACEDGWDRSQDHACIRGAS